MVSRVVGILCAVAVLILSSSCSLMKYTRLSPGELRLMSLRVPETMRENLPYEAVINYKAEGKPDIKRICFRWVTERISGSSPSLYWYTYESPSNQDVNSPRTRWAAETAYAEVSPSYCIDARDMKQEISDQLSIRLTTSDFKPTFNRIDLYAEYVLNGEVRETNKVYARFSAEQ